MMDIEERVKEIIHEQLSVRAENVLPEALLTKDLGADSLDQAKLVMAMEEEFGISIPDEDADGISTVKDAIEYIKHATGYVKDAVGA